MSELELENAELKSKLDTFREALRDTTIILELIAITIARSQEREVGELVQSLLVKNKELYSS